ncbi:hypothetical protein [Cellulosimicrobium cellulans]|uniref:hypothetical protein n=1 Tax=Cellulosimicrobium cellulans TaxID=1710 RepID=UPI00130DF9F7|nr:hypothetical protein [Cellulosimicrobium cellulans]
MSVALRTAVAVALALPAAGLGGAAAAAAHYGLVQPSDDELRSAAAEVVPEGFTVIDPPVVSGAWPPAFYRGQVFSHAQTDAAPDPVGLTASLAGDGWEVREVEPSLEGGTEVHAGRGGVEVVASLDPRPAARGADLGVSVRRGDPVPSYPVLVGVGLAVGAAGGAVAGARLGGRLRTRRQREYAAWRHRTYGGG